MKFALSTAQNIDAALYSIDGKKLITLLNNEKTDAGNHQMEINTGQISNGLYILKVNEAYFKIEIGSILKLWRELNPHTVPRNRHMLYHLSYHSLISNPSWCALLRGVRGVVMF